MSAPTHFIPLDREEVAALCRDRLASHGADKVTRLFTIFGAWYHHRLHAQAQALKQRYLTDPERFAEVLGEVVETANFTEITRADLQRALSEESLFRLRLEADFDDFEEIVFYRRGASRRTAEIKRWLGLSKQPVEFTNFELVLVYVRFRDLHPGEKRDDLDFEPGTSLLKLFANVPEADLEMLLPNTKVRMRLMDKLLIGVPAFFSGVAVLTTKLGGTLLILGGVFAFWLGLSGEPVTLNQPELAALLTAAATLGGYLWKQYSNFKNRKIRFMKTLAENLYFKTLAHNEGVLSYLIDRAEESEFKEALLAYTGLLVLNTATAAELKAWVDAQLDGRTDFEVADALAKLSMAGLLRNTGADGKLSVLGLAEAYQAIDSAWDALFQS